MILSLLERRHDLSKTMVADILNIDKGKAYAIINLLIVLNVLTLNIHNILSINKLLVDIELRLASD